MFCVCRWITQDPEDVDRKINEYRTYPTSMMLKIPGPAHGGDKDPENSQQTVDNVVRFVAIDEWRRLCLLAKQKKIDPLPSIDISSSTERKFQLPVDLMKEVMNQKFEFFGKEKHCINLVHDDKPISLQITPAYVDPTKASAFLKSLCDEEDRRDQKTFIQFRVTFILEGEMTKADEDKLDD